MSRVRTALVNRNIGDRFISRKSDSRQARGNLQIDEAIIVRANEHYCQRDVDKNDRANHEIPRVLVARLESEKKSCRPADRSSD